MKWLAECMAEPPDEYKSKDDFQKEVVSERRQTGLNLQFVFSFTFIMIIGLTLATFKQIKKAILAIILLYFFIFKHAKVSPTVASILDFPFNLV